MIGFLRLVGLINAAAWLGAAIFFLGGVAPGLRSPDALELLGPRNFPIYGPSLEQLLAARWVYLQTICALVAVVHLLAEWLYLGRVPPRLWRAWLLGLCVLTLLGGFFVQPKLKRLHQQQYSLKTSPAAREQARLTGQLWRGTFTVLEILLAGGVAVYLWRVANPPDKTKFVATGHFLG